MKNVVLSPSMTGISSPDPLKFAFVIKDNAHSSRGGSHPITLDESQWKKWWSTPTSAKTRALYIHIPFCRKRCSFCSFFENGANPARISRYVEQLSKQLEIASQTPFIQSHKFDTVYVGGGTPTDIQPNEIAMIGDAIQKFPLIDGAEITLEGRINGFTDEKFNAALSAKFNRFSFGIQSFNTQVRKAAGRLDSREEQISRIQQLSNHPTATIVADLIFGLPGQTMDIWQQDIKDIIESGAHGVDLYQLISLPGTRLSKQAEKEKLTLQNARKAKPNLLAPAADNQTRAIMYARDLHIWNC